jgi:hypothetical protein
MIRKSVILSRSAAEAKNLVVCIENRLFAQNEILYFGFAQDKLRTGSASLLRMTGYQNQCGGVLEEAGRIA